MLDGWIVLRHLKRMRGRTLDFHQILCYNKTAYTKSIMTKTVVIVKVPSTYTTEQKQDLELQVNRVVETGGAIIIPNDVDVLSLPVGD